ncbi:hypothetical protein GH890_31980, partial [Bacillus thuringiensis]|nr:hypothetical protein [Bacillus thuringiensis]
GHQLPRHLNEGRLKTLSQCICKGKITHMDSVSSDGSRYSIDQLLQDRKPDPEEMLRNLGFTAGSKTESRRCVPARFLQSPSR